MVLRLPPRDHRPIQPDEPVAIRHRHRQLSPRPCPESVPPCDPPEHPRSPRRILHPQIRYPAIPLRPCFCADITQIASILFHAVEASTHSKDGHKRGEPAGAVYKSAAGSRRLTNQVGLGQGQSASAQREVVQASRRSQPLSMQHSLQRRESAHSDEAQPFRRNERPRISRRQSARLLLGFRPLQTRPPLQMDSLPR